VIMSFELRTLVVGLATFAAAGLVVAALVPWLVSRRAHLAAGARARFLARVRLLPSAAASVAGVMATAAFLMFESRRDDESMSGITIGLAVCGGLLLAASAWRWGRLVISTERITREWFRTGQPVPLDGIAAPATVVNAPFPIVAVVGLFRPRLVIARSVLSSCTTDELRAVLAHEQGHLDRRDNLRRLVLTTTPDVLAWLPISGRMFTAWCDAAEEAADEEAARIHRDGNLHLASALVKVARLAASSTPTPLPTAALFTGDNLDSRVRRLLASPPKKAGGGMNGAGVLVALTIVAIVVAGMTPGVHELIERVIHFLP